MKRDADTQSLPQRPDRDNPTGQRQLVRPVTAADGPDIHRLLSPEGFQAPADTHRWLKQWRWATVDNPFRNDRPAGWVVWTEGRLVGYLGASHLPLIVHGNRRDGLFAHSLTVIENEDATVAAGAARALARALFDQAGQQPILVHSPGDPLNAVFREFGCRPVAVTTERWSLPATPTQVIQTTLGGRHPWLSRLFHSGPGIRLAHTIETLNRRWRRLPAIPLPADCRLEVTTPRLADDHGLFARSNGTIGIHRTRDFLDWRYARYPGTALLRVIMLRKRDEGPIAAVVLAVEDDRRTAHIEDLAVKEHRRELIHTLFIAAAREACRHGARRLVTPTGAAVWRPHYPLFGFRPRPRPAAGILAHPDSFGVSISELQERFELWHGPVALAG